MSRILIIDDDEDVRIVIGAVLESADHEVALAADGASGLQLQRECPFDLVIADLFMPIKEGVETICDLKDEFADIKIIAISERSFKGRNYLPVPEALGVQKILSKPIASDTLLKSIEEV